MPVTVDKEGSILHFEKRREAVRGNSHLMLYEANLDAGVFVYLYLRPATCSLVWRGPQERKPDATPRKGRFDTTLQKGLFDPTLPLQFFDTQFSKKPPSKVENLKRSVEKGGSMLHIPYRFTKHRVTLFLAGEERLREYDLANAPDEYETEIAYSDNALANIAFARFDADIEYKGPRKELEGHRVSYSLTFERLGDSASDGWEFAISLPRDLKLELEEATLKWIARLHRTEEMLGMNFKVSLDKLSKILKPQRDQIHVYMD